MKLLRNWIVYSCLIYLLTLLSGVVAIAQEFVTRPSHATALASRDIKLSKETEVALEITASSPGASWAKSGAEAAAVLIEVDGRYSQDVLLWAGASPFIYRVLLGRLSTGNHRVTVLLNKSRSAVGAQRASVSALKPIPLTRDSHHTTDDVLALTYAPILYQRPNTIDRFSDLPILMYYEVSHPNDREVEVRYTCIFTNEDGGTPTAALMARWGRAADIEWVYEFRARDGEVIEETYQGISHETKRFSGERINGKHPLLAVASDNNNFSDQLQSSVKFSLLPIAVNLQNSTRESVMDAHPWTYRVVAEELLREKKLKSEPTDVNSISDPRNYLYVDLQATQKGSTISVEAISDAESRSSVSDIGEPKLRIDRSGYFRTAIRLRSAKSAAAVSSIIVHCYSDVSADCEDVHVKSVVVLTQDYKPRFLQFHHLPPRTVHPNDAIKIELHKSSNL